MRARFLPVPAMCLAVACAAKPVAPHPVHVVKGCSPLRYTGAECFGPFPNAWYEQPAASTATGYTVVVPAGVMPLTATSGVLDTTMIGNEDGFSPATQIVVYFQQGVNTAQLTPTATSPIADRISLMMQADSPIVLLDVAAKKRVPLFAEPDANAMAGQRQALLIHPMVRLTPQSRYAVAILNTLHDALGNPLAPEGQFKSWVDGSLGASDSLYEISGRLDDEVAAFAAVGVKKSSMALAWDFDTASDAATTGQLETMVQQALAVPESSLSYAVTSAEPDTADFPNAATVVIGTFEAPSFETGANPSPLKYDANHAPVIGAVANWPFTAVIPTCALTATAPVPLLIVGHGLFGSAWEELNEDDSGGLFNKLCMVAIGTNWEGLSNGSTKPGLPSGANDVVTLVEVLSDPNQFDLITGRLQQAHVNFQQLVRIATGAMASDAAFKLPNGMQAYNPANIYYWGASNGGIQGATFLSLSATVNRGVLNVPGGIWSLLMWRSLDFQPALPILNSTYPDPLDQQLTLAFTQSMFDKTDPIEFAPHLMGTAKQVLFQESEGDDEVTNIATRTEMRTIAAQPLAPLLDDDYGFSPVSGPLSGLVYTQFTANPSSWPPYANTPAAADNQVHETMRWLPEVLTQTQTFLTPGGLAVQTRTP